MRVAWVVFVVCLLYPFVCGDEKSLSDAKTAVEELWDPVDVLFVNLARVTFQDKINMILRRFRIIDLAIDKLENDPYPDSEFDQFIHHKVHNMEVFDIIMKLLYAQSDRTRSDFTSLGGPHIRMYAFGIIARILARFGAIEPGTDSLRKQYLHPLLLSNDPTKFYKRVDEDLEEKQEEWMEGPFFDAIETIEGQVYNYYYQWFYNSGLSAPAKVNTMNAALQNMLVVLDYVMHADDFISPAVETQEAAYIYFLQNNNVYNILQKIADGDHKEDRESLAAYAKFLIYTYFVDEAEETPPEPEIRWQPLTYPYNKEDRFRLVE